MVNLNCIRSTGACVDRSMYSTCSGEAKIGHFYDVLGSDEDVATSDVSVQVVLRVQVAASRCRARAILDLKLQFYSQV